MSEIWKRIDGWPAYEVSNLGRVRSIDRSAPNGGGRQYLVAGRLLTPRLNQSGYCVVTLRAGKTIRATPRVHRLVAVAFISNPGGKPYVNHIDCVTWNNHASNLEWCTQGENLAHMDALGRRVNGAKGRRPTVALLTDDQVRQLRLMWAGGNVSFSKLGSSFGISKRAAMRCAKRETYADVQ